MPQPSADPIGHLRLANRLQKKLEDVPDHPTIAHRRATTDPNSRTGCLQNRKGFLLQPTNSRQTRQNSVLRARKLLTSQRGLQTQNPPVQFPAIRPPLPILPHISPKPNFRDPLHNPNLPDQTFLFLVSRPPSPPRTPTRIFPQSVTLPISQPIFIFIREKIRLPHPPPTPHFPLPSLNKKLGPLQNIHYTSLKTLQSRANSNRPNPPPPNQPSTPSGSSYFYRQY